MSDRLMRERGVKTPWGVGWMVKPFTQWRRTEGVAAFFQDRMALRKSLSLCHRCETVTLPRGWESRYGYEQVKSFHGEGIGCDYCRADEPTNLYIPEEGDLATSYREMIPSVRETLLRDSRSRK